MHSIFHTKHGEILQSDAENCFYLHFKGNSYKLNACTLIAFKSKLDAVNIEALLLSDASESNVEIISLCNRDRVLVMTIDEVIELKELISGSLVMLELNSIVHQRISRVLA